MSWEKGLLRIWVVASLLWAALVVVVTVREGGDKEYRPLAREIDAWSSIELVVTSNGKTEKYTWSNAPIPPIALKCLNEAGAHLNEVTQFADESFEISNEILHTHFRKDNPALSLWTDHNPVQPKDEMRDCVRNARNDARKGIIIAAATRLIIKMVVPPVAVLILVYIAFGVTRWILLGFRKGDA